MYQYISVNPSILGGKPCIQGTRISVEMILEWVASGASVDDIVKSYPYLSRDTVVEALKYASEYMNNEVVIEVSSSPDEN